MKKKLFAALLLSCLFMTGCTKGEQQSPTTSPSDTVLSKISFYKKEYQKRYLSYQEKNPSLNEQEIVTRVNMGIDQPYYTSTKETPYLNQENILVNKYYYLKSDYTPDYLEKISKECSSTTRMLTSTARQSFEKLCSDAAADGLTIRAMSAYRSYSYQNTLYQNYVKKDGIESADTYSARPGFSEHQTGLVVDVDNKTEVFTDFGKTKEFTWMEKNAYRYGFILRYPKGKENLTGYDYEAWHYRYVGEKIATEIQKQSITFDEYYAQNLE